MPPAVLRRRARERPAHKGDFLESFENMPGSQAPWRGRRPDRPSGERDDGRA